MLKNEEIFNRDRGKGWFYRPHVFRVTKCEKWYDSMLFTSVAPLDKTRLKQELNQSVNMGVKSGMTQRYLLVLPL